MKKAFCFLFCCGLITTVMADVAVGFLHDISVRIALKSRLKDYRQEFPRPKGQPLPEYPILWREQGVTGEATLKFTVTEKGAIADLQVVAASQKEFAEASLSAVKKWVYAPALDIDKKTPISCDLLYLFVFERHDE